jgi:hypothetical protein
MCYPGPPHQQQLQRQQQVSAQEAGGHSRGSRAIGACLPQVLRKLEETERVAIFTVLSGCGGAFTMLGVREHRFIMVVLFSILYLC